MATSPELGDMVLDLLILYGQHENSDIQARFLANTISTAPEQEVATGKLAELKEKERTIIKEVRKLVKAVNEATRKLEAKLNVTGKKLSQKASWKVSAGKRAAYVDKTLASQHEDALLRLKDIRRQVTVSPPLFTVSVPNICPSISDPQGHCGREQVRAQQAVRALPRGRQRVPEPADRKEAARAVWLDRGVRALPAALPQPGDGCAAQALRRGLRHLGEWEPDACLLLDQPLNNSFPSFYYFLVLPQAAARHRQGRRWLRPQVAVC